MRTTVTWVLALMLVACGPEASLDRTLATFTAVRGEAQLDGSPTARVARAAAEQTLSVGDGGLARLRLDTGAQLLLEGGAEVGLLDETSIALAAGRVYAEAQAGEELHLTAGDVTLRASDAAVSAEQGDALRAYVVRGEVSWTRGEERGIARAGERLVLTGAEARTEPVELWRDWTGGLAQPGPADARGARGIGALEARVPDEIGQARWPLVMRRLDVSVRIEGDLAVTEVEQVFFNPASEMVEGLYRVRVPEEAVLQRFAVDRDGRLVDGYVKEKAQARAQYEAQVYRGSQLDPALLEWVAPGQFQARIYPIRAGETRRIVIRYAEWLHPVEEGGPRLYRYPMGGGRDAPRVQELSIAVDVEDAGATRLRAGLGASIEDGRVRLRRSDFAPRADFWLELPGEATGQRAWLAPHEPPPRAPDARAVVGEADERDYWYLPLRLPDALFADDAEEPLRVVVVADVSAATDRAHLELGRSVTEALVAHLRPDDEVAIVASDLALRPLGDGAALGPAEPARIERLLDDLARAPSGGATDLGAALAEGARLLEGRPGAVVYVGDGAPTVGELEADGLLARMARLPAPVRLYAVGVGSDADLDLLEALSRGGGLAQRVEERSAAADAALRILEHVGRPVVQRVTVELGAGVENVYPRRPVDVVRGDVLAVVGRVRETPPTEVVVRGEVRGEPFEETIAIATQPSEESTDLRLRWAGERLRQLLLEGATREEVAELGTRYGLITPFTSYYVPSAQELIQMGGWARAYLDRPSLFAQLARDRVRASDIALGVALGPLSIAGCTLSSDDAPAVQASAAEYEDEVAMEPAALEEEMGATEGGGSANRYGIEGPSDNADPAMARQEAREQARSFGPTGGAAQGQAAPGAFAAADTAEAVLPEVEVPEAPPPPEEPAPVAAAATTAPVQDILLDGFGRGGGGTVGSTRARRSRPRSGLAQNAARLGRSGELEEDSEESGAATTGLGTIGLGTIGRLGGRRAGAPDADDDAGDDSRARDTNVVVTVTLPQQDATRHARRRCSDAASASLDDRRALWRERLGQQSYAGGWIQVYRQAIRDCEAPAWRDRRALLDLTLARAGQVSAMIDVYRLFTSGSARGYLRAAILRRVRSPEDLRRARLAFGLGADPDWELVEQVLSRATGEAARVRALRRLVTQYPDSFELKLRLLEELETTGRVEEARRLADALRHDPRSDAGVRTAIGEMYLRMDQEEEARRVFSEIVEFAPLDELARRRLGDLYRAHGWNEDAYRQYETLLSIRPDSLDALLLLAQAAAGAGRIDEALRLERRLMETSEPGAERGLARVALLWSSVRLAKLRAQARGDEERLEALARRTRRSGVLSAAGDLRVTLTWSHPDAQLALYAAHPDTATSTQRLARPLEIAPEHGVEAFDVPEQEDGAYRFEVRRADASAPTDVSAQLVVVWREGDADEKVEVVDLAFTGGRDAYRFRLEGDALTPHEG